MKIETKIECDYCGAPHVMDAETIFQCPVYIKDMEKAAEITKGMTTEEINKRLLRR